MSTWFITGCSSGLGRALAEAAISAGHSVVATARDVSTVADLADAHPQQVLAVAVDVTRTDQVVDAVLQATHRFGGVDVLVNNAGYGYRAAVEGLSGSLRGELAPLGISVTIVEPGAFRTDFAGRSLTQSATAIDDYADTAGKRRKEHDTMHGTQAGDPAKAATAIIAAVESDNPPGFLLLGSDALALHRQVADARAAEVAAWESVTVGTDYTEG